MRPLLSLCLLLLPGSAGVAGPPLAGVEAQPVAAAREIFAELVRINTTDSVGDNTAAARAMETRLLAAGFARADVAVLGQERNPRKGNLVARLRGRGDARPLLLLAHLDVVEVEKGQWTVPPFELTEQGGFYYGRGTSDDKHMAAIFIANLIRYKREGFVPRRDIIVALTADEEWGDYNGVRWLLEQHRPLIDAEFALNEGGGGQIRGGRYRVNEVQLSEKNYASFRIEAKSPGGHSSRPGPENAIYRLAKALARLGDYRFPVNVGPVTRSYFERMASVESGQVAFDMRAVAGAQADPAAARRLSQNRLFNALLRTTCVATLLKAGTAENALPESATAVVNCRILPHETLEQTRAALIQVIGDSAITVEVIGAPIAGPAAHVNPVILRAVEAVTIQMWPGVVVVPVMSTGATDGLFLRNAGLPVYGVSGVFQDIDDNRAHARDERIPTKSFDEGLEFLYRLVKSLADSPAA